MRTLTAAYIAQLDAATKTPAVFYEGEFKTGTVHLWSGFGDKAWNGHTWLGAGAIASVSPIQETSEIKADGIRCTLTGIPSEFVALALEEQFLGAAGKVWLGFIADNGDVVIDPALAFYGHMDVPTLSDDGQTCTLTIAYENRLKDLERPRELRYTHESQQALFDGDLGFEYVPSLQEWNGTWGR